MTFNPSVQIQCAMNVARSLTGNAPTIMQLLHTYDYPEIQVWMIAQINDLNEYAGVKTKMSLDQMKELAKVLIVKCKFLKASEILLFFHMLKGGDFGSFYGTVDPQRVGEHMNEFLKWRRMELDKIHSIQKQIEHEQKHKMWRKNAISREEYERRREEREKQNSKNL